jgi:filamentous hemagglutinin
MEQKLGLDAGSLTSGKTVALDIKPQDIKNLRMPSGNELGANSQWIPGGYTSGGVPEAVMDFTGVPFTPIPF